MLCGIDASFAFAGFQLVELMVVIVDPGYVGRFGRGGSASFLISGSRNSSSVGAFVERLTCLHGHSSIRPRMKAQNFERATSQANPLEDPLGSHGNVPIGIATGST